MRMQTILLSLMMSLASLQAAELTLNRYFSDNMVIQRDKPLVIRGTADKGAEVTVTFSGQTKTGIADGNGHWSVILDPLSVNSKAQSLAVTSSIGNLKSDIKNVLIGDVILHARQTSIDIMLGRDEAGGKVAASTRPNPMFRAIVIKAIPAAEPRSNLARESTAGWRVVDQESALKMTASAYYLGRDLAKDADVPVGIIDINMGSAFANSWLSDEALMETGKFYEDTEVAGQAKKFKGLLEAEQKGETIGKQKTPPKNTLRRTLFPSGGYNGTLHPLAGIGLKAVVLQLGNDYPYMPYQALMDSENPFDGPALDEAYDETYDIRKTGFRMESKVVPRITREWRKYIGDDGLPFGLIVPPGSDLFTFGQHNREMRELQRLVAEDNPNVGIILPGSENIAFSAQPADEELLAKRCLGWFEGAVSKKPDTPATGPLFDRVEASFNEAAIYFKAGTAKGLKANGNALGFFEAANVEGDYVAVKAEIDGETIRIESDSVSRITRVRYNWNHRPDQGLLNASGLPAIPFRSERAAHDWYVRNEENDLPEEYFLPANEWKKSDVTLINVALQGRTAYDNFSGWIGPAGFRVAPFGPNMGVREVKEGSPAEGKLFQEDVIYSANGKPLGEASWEVMSAAITDSETRKGHGKLVLGVRRGTENLDVELTLEVMGTYSSTAPYDCPKTEKIISNLEKWVVARGAGPGFLNYDAAFMLATGNPELHGYVRRAVYEILEKKIPTEPIDGTKAPQSWFNSAEAYLLGEYYLATGDKNVLPHLKFACDRLSATQNKEVGGWRHNFPGGPGYGMIPNAGLPGVMGMWFAQQAGVQIDKAAFDLAIYHYTTGRAETGTMLYAPTQCSRPPTPLTPENVLNGKMTTYNGGVSCAGILMRFIGNEKAAHICSTDSVYAFNNTYGGHGGNFWNNMWTPLGAHQAGKESFTYFWKNHRWYHELSRMYDGELIGGAQNKTSAGFGVALVAPRERLQIVGAPPSPFAVTAPEVLKPALDAYWKKDYARAEKLANELIASGTVGLDDLPTVKYFARAAKELPETFDADFIRMQKLIDAGDLYGAKAFLAGLDGVMAAADERLMAMHKRLDDVPVPPKQKAKNEDEKSTEKPRKWFCLITDSQFKEPPKGDTERHAELVNRKWERTEPEDASTLNKANLWKIMVFENIGQAPKGWFEPTFDDSAWLETTLPKSWRMYHTAVLRTRFNVVDKDQYDGLRLQSWIMRQQGVELYLNGELIGKINGAVNTSTIQQEFKTSALKHLKNGENSFVIKTTHNWRWGGMDFHVYNGGFDFNLDARIKE